MGASLRNGELAYGALLLFATNLIGIMLSCAAVFAACRTCDAPCKQGLIATAVTVLATAVPLGFATSRLLEQSRLEAVLRHRTADDRRPPARTTGEDRRRLAVQSYPSRFVGASSGCGHADAGRLPSVVRGAAHRPASLARRRSLTSHLRRRADTWTAAARNGPILGGRKADHILFQSKGGAGTISARIISAIARSSLPALTGSTNTLPEMMAHRDARRSVRAPLASAAESCL